MFHFPVEPPVPVAAGRRTGDRVRGERRSRFGEAGGASIEYAGVTAAAAVVVVAVALAVGTVAPGVSDLLRWAWCEVTTLGEGNCGRSTSAAEKVPPQPCVVRSDEEAVRGEIEVLVFKTAAGRRFEVARLSDGGWRVTQLSESRAGVEAGVGGGVTLTWKDRTVGANAKAEAGGFLDAGRGLVWYTRDEREVARMLSENREDVAESVMLGGGVRRWFWERGQDLVGAVTGNGDYELPEADEEFLEGGGYVEASAEATGGTDRAEASVSVTRVLGRRVTRGGVTTYYLRTTLGAGAALQGMNEDFDLEAAGIGGEIEVLTAVALGPDGEMREVAVTGLAAGESRGLTTALFGGSGDASFDNEQAGAVVYQATLPIRDGVDRRVATDFLVASGVAQLGPLTLDPVTAAYAAGSIVRFIDASMDRGYTTRQTFRDEGGTTVAIDAEAKLGVELGAGASVEQVTRISTGADYWDGSTWVARNECVGGRG